MRTIRSHRSFALLGLAVVVFVSCLPTDASDLVDAVLTPLWIVLPTVSIVAVRRTATRCQDQPLALRSLASFRAPPAALAVV
jgi:hypothetical protein